MIKAEFTKPTLTIECIGKKAFWSGCLLGIFTAVSLQFFFIYMRTFTLITLFLLERDIPNVYFEYFNIFFAAISTSLGFCVTTIFWLRGYNQHIKKRYLKTMAITNAALSLCLTLFLLSKLGFVLFSVVFSCGGALLWNEMILHDYLILLILLPICIFLNQWNMIRLIFRTKRWFLPILSAYLLISTLLFLLV